jgi:hypothetical protein
MMMLNGIRAIRLDSRLVAVHRSHKRRQLRHLARLSDIFGHPLFVTGDPVECARRVEGDIMKRKSEQYLRSFDKRQRDMEDAQKRDMAVQLGLTTLPSTREPNLSARSTLLLGRGVVATFIQE